MIIGSSREVLLNITTRCFLQLMAIFFYTPVAMTFIQVGTKPVDFVLSDLLVAILIFYYIPLIFYRKISSFESQIFILIIGVTLFFILLGLFGTLETGTLLPLFSATKYTKVFFALLAGMGFAHLCAVDDFWRLSTRAAVIIVALLLFSQIVITGNLAPRWGEMFLGAHVYGFPNSFATYCVVLLMLVIAAWTNQRKLYLSFVAVIAAGFVVMSLSRSGMVALFFGILAFFAVGMSWQKLLKFLMISFVFLCCGWFIMHSTGSLKQVESSLNARFARTFEKKDPSSGRIDIAAEALNLVADKPLLGYHFDSFSKYHEGHDSTHNQYLEAFFKTGLLGFFVYFFIILLLCYIILRKMQLRFFSFVSRRYIIAFMCSLFAISAGNLTQPNFTYSQTGNVIFFTLGFLVLARPCGVRIDSLIDCPLNRTSADEIS